MVKRMLFSFAAFALLCVAPAARATGVNLFWNECAAGGGVSNVNWACNSNVGLHALYGSVVPPPGITRATGVQVVVDLLTQDPGFTAWWAFRGVGACRIGLNVSGDLSGTPGCSDFLRALGGPGTTTFTRGFAGMSDRARITTTFLYDSSLAVPVEGDREYYAVRYTILNSNTIGANACTGCTDGVCLVLNSVAITQVGPLPTIVVSGAASNDHATWQGGLSGDCALVPVKNRTWGAIKSLYH